jgi:hypothetical protein
MYIVKSLNRKVDPKTGKLRVYRSKPGRAWNKKGPVDPGKLYLCQSCNEWKTTDRFLRKGKKVEKKLKSSKMCNVCRRAAVGRWLRAYYEKLKSDPAAQLEALRKYDALKPNPHVSITKFVKWRIGRNSLLSRIGLRQKYPPLDIVAYVNRKVKYGRLTPDEATYYIERYYEKHPEARPKVEPVGVIRPNIPSEGSNQ